MRECRVQIKTFLSPALNEARTQDAMEISSHKLCGRNLTPLHPNVIKISNYLRATLILDLLWLYKIKTPPLQPKMLLNQLLKYAP
ncbi:15837_t:CDS:1, partial [Dentiscutata erythropus]